MSEESLFELPQEMSDRPSPLERLTTAMSTSDLTVDPVRRLDADYIIGAAIAQTRSFMQSRKRIVANGMANAIFRLWLEEAINNDRLETFRAKEADKLYTNGYQNLMFDALSNADWIGASRGQIDELKETQAAVLRIKYGLSTHEDELSALGKDWRKVYVQLEREKKERDKRNITLLEDNSVNAASGSPRQSQQDGTGTGSSGNGTKTK